jgi:hypothetical protein|tara:strand:+ start:793 stop:999 length:207 start_codon:yes stop_codon:yes gene_type:complete
MNSHFSYNKNNALMSEGANPNFSNVKNKSFKQNGGHINISDILNGKIQPGLISGANNPVSFDQIYTDN